MLSLTCDVVVRAHEVTFTFICYIACANALQSSSIICDPWNPYLIARLGAIQEPTFLVHQQGHDVASSEATWNTQLILSIATLNPYQKEHSTHIKRNTHIIKRNTHRGTLNSLKGTLILLKGTH